MRTWVVSLIILTLLASMALAAVNSKPAQAPRTYRAPTPVMYPEGDRLDLIFESFEDGVPPMDWTIMTSGESYTWAQEMGESHSGAASAAVRYGPTGAWQDEWLVTPAIDASALSGITLEFWEAEAYWADWGFAHSIMVSTTVPDDPAAFSTLITWTPADHTIVSWADPIELDLSAYAGEPVLYVAFRYEGEYADDWYIDDVWIYEPSDHDVKTQSVSPENSILAAGEPVVPEVVVKNIGLNTESFPVSLTIASNEVIIYMETMEVVDLAPGEDLALTFPSFIPEAGYLYELTGMTMLEGDEDPGNDTYVAYNDCFSGQRTPFAMLVTNWDCGPCVQANVALDEWYPGENGMSSLVRVHGWWPGDDDPMYLANVEQCDFLINNTPTGADFAPHLWVDNYVDGSSTGAEMPGFIDAQKSVASPMELMVQYDQDMSYALVNVDVMDPLRPGHDYRLFVAVTEDGVEALGGNGEEFHNQAFRMLYPGIEGMAIDTAVGQAMYQVDMPLDEGWVYDNLRLVAYVQNMNTGVVQNSFNLFLHEGSVAIEDPAVPEDTPALATALDGAFPNPFNPKTAISFTVGATQHVRLDVYDVEGRRVSTLADGIYEAGSHRLDWQGQDAKGRDLPSGTYMVRMVTANTVKTSKMTLVR